MILFVQGHNARGGKKDRRFLSGSFMRGDVMKKSLIIVVLAVLFFSFLFVACVSKPVGVTPTPQPTEDKAKWYYFNKTFQAENRATSSALPEETPDTRSNFEKCVENTGAVRYVITGDNVDAVSLTWQNDTGGTNQGDYKLPFCQPYSGFSDGDFLYIAAQIIQPTSGAGTITCTIYGQYSNTVISMAKASNFPSIATCSGSK